MDNTHVVPNANQSDDVTNWICATLRGERLPWLWPDDAQAIRSFVATVDIEGVGPLLHRLRASDWPMALREALHKRAAAAAMWELYHGQSVTEALRSLAAAGVPAILIKGTALAYSHYPEADLRSRGDTDLVISPQSVERTCEVLQSQGFRREIAMRGRFISYQSTFTKVDPAGFTHALDVHWRLSNSEVLSQLLTYDELARSASRLAKLDEQAMAASPCHLLLIACIHRCAHRQNPYFVDEVAHHTDSRLIWLYDIHLLAESLTAPEWESLTELAQRKGLLAICLEGLRLAQHAFGTRLPAAVSSHAAPDIDSAPSRYLESSKLRQQWMDFIALRNPLHQLQFIRELIFPPAAYMRAKYASDAPAVLPWLYLRRAAHGIGKRWHGPNPSP